MTQVKNQDSNEKKSDPSLLGDAFKATLRALGGDPRSANLLMLSQLPGDSVSPKYHAVISAQNGNKDLRFADALYWSGNAFNQIRAIFWCRDVKIELVEDVFWGGRLDEDEQPLLLDQHKHWKDILRKDTQAEIIFSAIKKLNTTKEETDILKKYSLDALNGSKGGGQYLWKYYQSRLNVEGMPMFSGGCDWIALCGLNIQGFPGPRNIDKCLYWMLIAAENGDPESQWQLANFHDTSQLASRGRRQFWLEKASTAGFEKAKKQLEDEKATSK